LQSFQVSAIGSSKTLEEDHPMTMTTYDDETPTPALCGLDLFGLVSFRLWPRGFDLAVLPRWLLALEVSFTSRGKALSGRVAGRGFYGEMRAPLPQGNYPLWAKAKEEDGHRYISLGRLWVVLDPRQELQAAEAHRIE